MDNKLVENFLETHQQTSLDESWDKFKKLPIDEQKVLFSKLLDVAASPKHNNKAVVLPNVASVIKRRLKPGVTFDKWYKGWLPPVESKQIGNDIVRDYFPIPTRVINLRGDDEQEFLTIGFVYNPFDSIEELLNARPKEIKNTESDRKEVNEDLLEYSENTFYAVSSDDIFGL